MTTLKTAAKETRTGPTFQNLSLNTCMHLNQSPLYTFYSENCHLGDLGLEIVVMTSPL